MAILTGGFCLKRGTGGGDFHMQAATLMTWGCGNGTLFLLWFSQIKTYPCQSRRFITNMEFTPSLLFIPSFLTHDQKTVAQFPMHCPSYISLLVIFCLIVYVTNKNLECNKIVVASPSVCRSAFWHSSDSYLAGFILLLWFTSHSSCLRTHHFTDNPFSTILASPFQTVFHRNRFFEIWSWELLMQQSKVHGSWVIKYLLGSSDILFYGILIF